MPITRSAKKAVKVSARRLTENLVRKNAFKRALKMARKAMTDPDAKKTSAAIIKAQSTLDRAVKTKLLHRNTASRLLSRLVKQTTAQAK